MPFIESESRRVQSSLRCFSLWQVAIHERHIALAVVRLGQVQQLVYDEILKALDRLPARGGQPCVVLAGSVAAGAHCCHEQQAPKVDRIRPGRR